jgi:hypothetical protein
VAHPQVIRIRIRIVSCDTKRRSTGNSVGPWISSKEPRGCALVNQSPHHKRLPVRLGPVPSCVGIRPYRRFDSVPRLRFLALCEAK